MNKKNIKIKSFTIENNNQLIILDNDNVKNYLICEKGNVITKILTCENTQVGINYLDIGDNIKIKYDNSNSNKIIIKKIYIKTKYDFNTESSDDIEF